MSELDWQGAANVGSNSYTCGYCGNPLASNIGYYANRVIGNNIAGIGVGHIYICHYCSGPTYFDEDGVQHPGTSFGRSVGHIPSKDVEALYEEARNCMKVGAYTAAVMCCRKLLMHIAVSEGAEENLSFKKYVDYLLEQGFLPKRGKDWVDHVRDKGNDANHEITIMEREDAEQLISFIEMMLTIMYEYPATIKAREQEKQPRPVGRAPDTSQGSAF